MKVSWRHCKAWVWLSPHLQPWQAPGQCSLSAHVHHLCVHARRRGSSGWRSVWHGCFDVSHASLHCLRPGLVDFGEVLGGQGQEAESSRIPFWNPEVGKGKRRRTGLPPSSEDIQRHSCLHIWLLGMADWDVSVRVREAWFGDELGCGDGSRLFLDTLLSPPGHHGSIRSSRKYAVRCSGEMTGC